MGWLSGLRAAARALKSEGLALYLAARDPRTPLAAKLVVLAIVAYILSPIDLIPDFIPVLGLLDDLVLAPIAIRFALRLIPADVMSDARLRAPQLIARGTRLAKWGAVAIVVLWLFVAVFLYFAIRGLMSAAL